MKMYINGKRTETVGVSEGLDVGEEVGEEVGCIKNKDVKKIM